MIATKLDWLKRARHDQTDVANRTIWETRDHLFKVIHSRPMLSGLPEIFYAIAKEEDGERIVSRHRKRATAFQAVERFARGEN